MFDSSGRWKMEDQMAEILEVEKGKVLVERGGKGVEVSFGEWG